MIMASFLRKKNLPNLLLSYNKPTKERTFKLNQSGTELGTVQPQLVQTHKRFQKKMLIRIDKG